MVGILGHRPILRMCVNVKLARGAVKDFTYPRGDRASGLAVWAICSNTQAGGSFGVFGFWL